MTIIPIIIKICIILSKVTDHRRLIVNCCRSSQRSVSEFTKLYVTTNVWFYQNIVDGVIHIWFQRSFCSSILSLLTWLLLTIRKLCHHRCSIICWFYSLSPTILYKCNLFHLFFNITNKSFIIDFSFSLNTQSSFSDQI